MSSYDKVFDSSKVKGYEDYQLACGHISNTTILFQQENIWIDVEAAGKIRFFAMDGAELTQYTLPKSNTERELYEDIRCSVEDCSIVLEFPIYSWIDHYPNCDGEHDRWTLTIKEYFAVKFDVKQKRVIE